MLASLIDKANVQQYVTGLYDTYKENYEIQVKLLNSDCSTTKWKYAFQVITSFNYTNLKEIDTVVSEEVIAIYDSEQKVITDLYSPYNYYDLAIRGDLCSDILPQYVPFAEG